MQTKVPVTKVVHLYHSFFQKRKLRINSKFSQLAEGGGKNIICETSVNNYNERWLQFKYLLAKLTWNRVKVGSSRIESRGIRPREVEQLHDSSAVEQFLIKYSVLEGYLADWRQCIVCGQIRGWKGAKLFEHQFLTLLYSEERNFNARLIFLSTTESIKISIIVITSRFLQITRLFNI